MKASPSEILEAIQELSPGQRRQLYRRLRTIGLLDTGGPWADTHRLRTAPAVRLTAAGRVAPESHPSRRQAATDTPSPASQTHAADTTASGTQEAAAPDEYQANEYQSDEYRSEEYRSEEYRSGVRSKVIMGAPAGKNEAALDVMAPVPGQAPDSPIRLQFDGGSRGNPGKGYGSYALDWPGLPQQVVRLRFGDGVTNNEAEYDTLISALEATIKKLEDSDADPKAAQVEIFGDSLLVVNQVLGKWEVKNPRMRTRCERVKYLLNQFGHWRLEHHDREHSVRTLGH